jgi:hypothetical protein
MMRTINLCDRPDNWDITIDIVIAQPQWWMTLLAVQWTQG